MASKDKNKLAQIFLAVIIFAIFSVSEANAFWWFFGAKAKQGAAEFTDRNKSLLTLKEAYRLALIRSETVAMKKETINEAQGHFYQAFNYIMPSVDFVMTRSDQDSQTGSGDFYRRSTPQKKFSFSQPLFSGFKEFAALKGAGAEKGQRLSELQRAKELLFQDVVEAFYAVRQYKKELELLNRTKKILENRLTELKRRARIGRSRDSEAELTAADLHTTQADAEEARRLLTVSIQLLEYCIGRPVTEDLADDPVTHDVSKNINSYLAKSHMRSDVRAAKDFFSLAEQNVVVAQSGLFPSVKATGNSYTQRVGWQEGNNWDLLLTVDVPVFEGTQVIGDIKTAVAQRESARHQYSKTKRLAELDIRNCYESYQSAALQENMLKEAKRASQKSFELNESDYRSNLVSNLEVLDSLRRYQAAHTRYNRAQYLAKRMYWRFKVAVGEAV